MRHLTERRTQCVQSKSWYFKSNCPVAVEGLRATRLVDVGRTGALILGLPRPLREGVNARFAPTVKRGNNMSE